MPQASTTIVPPSGFRSGDRLAALQQPWLVVGRVDRTTLRPGETSEVRVRLTGAGPAPAGTSLTWTFGDVRGAAALGTAELGSEEIVVKITAGARDTITLVPLELEAHAGDGTPLSTNTLEFCLVPSLETPTKLEPMDLLAEHILGQLRWSNVGKGKPATLLATRLTDAVRDALIAGRKVLLIANDMPALTDPRRPLPRDLVNFPKMEVREREGSYWDGRWMGAFTWRRKDGPWAVFPNGPMLDEHWTGLLPRHVLTGFRSTAFSGLVDAGVAVAWLHKAAAFSKRSFLGQGWLTATTFDFTGQEGHTNPLAPHLLNALSRS